MNVAATLDEMVADGSAQYVKTPDGKLFLRLDTGATLHFVEGGLKRIA